MLKMLGTRIKPRVLYIAVIKAEPIRHTLRMFVRLFSISA